MRLHSGDVWLHAAPMFHRVDAFAVYAMTAVSGTHVSQPVFDASATLRLMKQEGVTVLNMAGTVTVSLFSIPRLVGGRCLQVRVLLVGLHWSVNTPFAYCPPLIHVIVCVVNAGFSSDSACLDVANKICTAL